MKQNENIQSLYRLPANAADDLEELRKKIEQFKNGDVSAVQFRAFRVPKGVYEERKPGSFMLRVRLPAGIILPRQMRTLAQVAREYGNAILHITTRQDIQVHNVQLDDIHPALSALYEAGLSTMGGGSNTVRNISTCFDAGVCPNEAFDVTPYSIALTEFMLSDPLSYELPRKFKIAFSGCSKNCAHATVTDLGFIAKERNGEMGFAVYIGGGLGSHPRVSDLLEDFAPASEVHVITEAVKRVFYKNGDRKNRNKARLRFLVGRIGLDEFRNLYQKELEEMRKVPPAPLELGTIVHPTSTPQRSVPSPEPLNGFEVWKNKSVSSQKQSGFYLVHISLFLGDIGSEKMVKLADIVDGYGEKMLRATQRQNIVIRGVQETELPGLYGKLAEIGLLDTRPGIGDDIVACTGASTCKLGICRSRDLASAIVEKLNTAKLDFANFARVDINISGCPNSCGRHQVSQIGFYGAARRIGGRLVKHYVVQLGGRVEEGKTRLAIGQNTLPAQNVPAFLIDLLTAFRNSTQYPNFDTFIDAVDSKTIDTIAAKHKFVPDFASDKNYYHDWGSESIFSLAGRGSGECSAGVLDMVETDLAGAKSALNEGKYYSAIILAARALLVTQGKAPSNAADVLMLFRKYFIDGDLVSREFDYVIAKAFEHTKSPEPEKDFRPTAKEVNAFVQGITDLYNTMDSSFRFANGKLSKTTEPFKGASERELDFRGVPCPLNYVKTKLALEQMHSGEVATVLLNEEGVKNVPSSVEHDGHKVLSITKQAGHWKVLVRKS